MSSAANDNTFAVSVVRERDGRKTRHPFKAILPRGIGSCGCASIGDALKIGAHWHEQVLQLPRTVPVKVALEGGP